MEKRYELMVFEGKEKLVRLERLMLKEYGSEANYIINGHGEYDGHKKLIFDTKEERDLMKLKLEGEGVNTRSMDVQYIK